MAYITIDGTEYESDNLSDKAKAELISVQTVDSKLEAVKTDMAIYQTARNAYAQALAGMLPEKEAHANKKKDVIEIDGKKYALEDFSDDAKAQLMSLQMVNTKLAEFNSELAVLQTARNAYSQSLKGLLPEAA